MVLAIHAGFAFLELGTVRRKNQVNALVKILVDLMPGRLQFPKAMRALITGIAESQSISGMGILSSASQAMHTVCASGMIFLPCAGGISHNEAESATDSDMASGARVLV